jgi:hypothetical protein
LLCLPALPFLSPFLVFSVLSGFRLAAPRLRVRWQCHIGVSSGSATSGNHAAASRPRETGLRSNNRTSRALTTKTERAQNSSSALLGKRGSAQHFLTKPSRSASEYVSVTHNYKTHRQVAMSRPESSSTKLSKL